MPYFKLVHIRKKQIENKFSFFPFFFDLTQDETIFMAFHSI